MKITLSTAVASLVTLIASAASLIAPAPEIPALVICTQLEDEIYGDHDSGRMKDSPQDVFAFCPTEAQWAEMTPWVRSRSTAKRGDYIVEAWDCDDMAREWVHWTHRWAVENFTKGDPYPIATYYVDAKIYDGFMGLRLNKPMFHALGLIRMSTGVWWLYDPALGTRIPLAQALYGEGNIKIRKVIW